MSSIPLRTTKLKNETKALNLDLNEFLSPKNIKGEIIPVIEDDEDDDDALSQSISRTYNNKEEKNTNGIMNLDMDKPYFYLSKYAQGSQQWLKSRDFRITGTRVSRILDFYDNYDDDEDIPLREETLKKLKGEISGDIKIEANDAMNYGSLHENDARNAHSLLPQNEGCIKKNPGLCISSEDSWLASSPDDIMYDKKRKKFIGVEYKCPYSQKLPNVVYNSHKFQAILNMKITGLSEWEIFYWTSTSGVRSYTLFFNKKEWDQYIYPKLKKFKIQFISPMLLNKNIEDQSVYSIKEDSLTSINSYEKWFGLHSK